MIIADSDVLIDFLRGRGEAARVAVEIESRSLGTTAGPALARRARRAPSIPSSTP
jgi:hypothetical protein